MRLTTKIILCSILSIFLLSLLFIITFSFSDRKNFRNTRYRSFHINIPQANQTAIKLPSYRVLVFQEEQTITENGEAYTYYYNDNCGLNLKPSTTTGDSTELAFPEAMAAFITTHTSHDTLTVSLKVDELREKYGMADTTSVNGNYRPWRDFTGVTLNVTASNAHVINRLRNVPTKVVDFDTDSILVGSSGGLTIASCKADYVKPLSGSQSTFRDCSIQTLHLDLDYVNEWKTENCMIEVLNFSSSKKPTVIFDNQDSEKVETVQWFPKNENAELNIKLKGKKSFRFHDL